METAPARTDAKRWAARGAAGLVGLLIGIVMLPNGLSALALSRNDAKAAVSDRATAETLAAAGEAALAGKRYDEAEAYARQSLARSRLNVVALRVAGLAREGRNAEDERAAGFMALAGQLGWRDTPTQVWYVNTASAIGEYEIAMQRADALLRRQEYPGQILAFVRAAGAIDQARPSVLARLVENPAWRPRLFLDAATMSEDQHQGLTALIAALRHSPAPVRREEIAPYLDGLVRARDPGRAYQVWTTAFGGKNQGWPRDPQFREAAALSGTVATALPFDWQIQPPPGVTARFDPQGGLTLDLGARRRGDVAQQLMRLAPGAYRFEATLAGSQARADMLLHWAITCLPSRIEAEAGPVGIATGSGGTVMHFDFRIPPNVCESQRLKLAGGSSNVGGSPSITISRVSIAGR